MTKQTRRVLITLPDELIDDVGQYAFSRGLTKSLLIQLLIEQELKKEGVIE